MRGFEKAKLIAGLVFNSIWLLVSVLLWIFGLIGFIEMVDSEGFSAWAIWGFMCAIPIAGSILKMAISAGRSNARDGERVYSAEVVGNTVYFRNHAWSYGFWGFVISLIVGVILGQVILPIFIIRAIKYIVNASRILKYSSGEAHSSTIDDLYESYDSSEF